MRATERAARRHGLRSRIATRNPRIPRRTRQGDPLPSRHGRPDPLTHLHGPCGPRPDPRPGAAPRRGSPRQRPATAPLEGQTAGYPAAPGPWGKVRPGTLTAAVGPHPGGPTAAVAFAALAATDRGVRLPRLPGGRPHSSSVTHQARSEGGVYGDASVSPHRRTDQLHVECPEQYAPDRHNLLVREVHAEAGVLAPAEANKRAGP